jgi:hypothetical protein
MSHAPQKSLIRNLLEAVIAVIAGNALYFLALWPHLPEHARHQVYRLDVGLAVDFWLCLACFGVVKWISNIKKRRSR